MSRVFGQSMGKKKGGASRYQRQMGGNKSASHSKRDVEKSEEELLAARRAEYRRKKQQEGEDFDISFGYARYDHKSEEKTQRGWVFNMLPTVRLNMIHKNSAMQSVFRQSYSSTPFLCRCKDRFISRFS